MAANSSAQLLVYEGFDYGGSDNANLSGMTANGGLGWAGSSAWTNGTAGSNQNSAYVAAGLSFDSPTGTDIAGVGGLVNLPNSASGPARIGRDLATPLSDIAVGGSKTVWMSFLYQRVSGPIGQSYATIVENTTNASQWSNGVFYGHHWSEDTLVNRPYAFQSGTASSGTVSDGATFFVLAKMEFSDTEHTDDNGTTDPGQEGDDFVVPANGIVDTLKSTMWVYESGVDDIPLAAPTIGGAIAGPGIRGTNADNPLEDFWFTQAAADSGDHYFDEIRIGGNFASVVPEPASAGLLIGLGAMAFVMIRRR